MDTLYQETASFSIRYVIASRWMIYLKTILDKGIYEAVIRVYIAIKKKTKKKLLVHFIGVRYWKT